MCVYMWSVFTRCGVIAVVRNRSQCDGQREEVTLDAALGLWLVCFGGNRKQNNNQGWSLKTRRRKDEKKLTPEGKSVWQYMCLCSF